MPKQITHWACKFEVHELDGSVDNFEGAACRGPDQGKNYFKTGLKEQVDCKSCQRMRPALKRKHGEIAND